ncbi:MAG TPA: hypothetical protein ENK18_24540 [Deltaproteobacteria bacterium]|nr:hypothetical protein [Deltaproteobacteria bacterium]
MLSLWLVPHALPTPYEGQVQPGERNYDLEVLYHQQAFEQGLIAVDARLAEHPEDKDLYWTKARFLFEIGERMPSDDPTIDREAHYKQMLEVVEQGLKIAPGDPGLRFARGAALARLATTRGVLASLWSAKEIEADWRFVAEHPTYRYASIEGIQVLPCDAYHALGMFYRLLPDRWIVGVLAGTRGDLDASLALHSQATRCKPHEIKNWKELAATQLCLGLQRREPKQVQQGLQSLDRALAIEPRSDKERTDLRHAKMLQDDPSMACSYSRDGQQDRDTTDLKAP